MSTFGIAFIIVFTAYGGWSVGVGLLDFRRGLERRNRGIGNILVGVGFLVLGWDGLETLLSALGAVIAIAGMLVLPLKDPKKSGGE